MSSALREIKAIVRKDCVPDLVRALSDAEVTRFFVSRIHALGAGVDPEDYKLSLEDGEAYTEKAKVEFLCPADRLDTALELVREWARTGHRGDGVVIVSDVADVVNVRTGDRDLIALI
ncbi:MAG: P-II family nitrogen regulator [Gemmatimonadales bacterium]|jgi:nitrogen regulatory protein PII